MEDTLIKVDIVEAEAIVVDLSAEQVVDVQADMVGERGAKGDAGQDSIIPGPAGADGRTPIKGVDYNDGLPGVKGDPGKDSIVPGLPGVDGKDGKDGADSTVPGPPGIDGKDGADSIIPGPKGDKGDMGEDSVVPGPAGADSTVPGPRGEDSTIPGPKGEDSTVPGPKGDQGEPSTVPGPPGVDGDDGYTPVKGVDYFDGADGAVSTVPGPPGSDGADGATPIKGVDYFDGADSTVPGPKGDTGDTGADSTVPGPPGADGEDGEPGLPGAGNLNSFVLSGALYENIPRNICAEVNTALLSSGRLSLVAIWLPAALTVNSISFWSATTALATGTNQLFGLYSNALALLRASVNDGSAAWAANTKKTLALVTSFVTQYSGLHYLGIMVAATTVPTVKGHTARTGGQLAASAPSMGGTSNTGLTTTLPNPCNAPATVTTNAWGCVN